MKKCLFAAFFAALLSLILSVDTDAQNLPDDVVINHGTGFGGGPRRTEDVTYIVAYDEDDNLIECCEDCEENEEYIEMLCDDPTIYVTTVTVEETVE